MTDDHNIELAKHLPHLRRVALRMLGNASDADDAVQEACLKAVRNQQAFAGRAQVATWLHRIVSRCALDRIRQRQRHDRRSLGDGNAILAGVVEYAATGPFEQAERNELCAVVNAAVAALPEDCRAAFVLTQFDGYSYETAGVILGQPRGTVASRVYRAKQILMGRLHEAEGMNNHERCRS